MQKRAGMSRQSRIVPAGLVALNCWGQVAQILALPTTNNSVLLFIIACIHCLLTGGE